jgi:hypothetical protein
MGLSVQNIQPTIKEQLMNEHEALKAIVEWYEADKSPGMLLKLIKEGRIALDLAIEQETIQKILDKVDAVAQTVKNDFAKIPKIIDDGEGEIHLEGYDQNDQFVSIRIPRGE